ncbi:MAG TPA: hypothetical protein VHI51_04970 [Ktedonobacterales bacterium]|jgi:hypothetical protein|nr:hypothetical protein [Ktedonobacterales bacterium]
MADEPDDNWLHAEVFPCPSCQQALFRVDHSPFGDDYLLYCDQCANCVEVSYYDSGTLAFADRIREEGTLQPGWPQTKALLRLIEGRLKPCSCGGRYRYDAARRCPFCLAPVLIDMPWIELWPGYFWVKDDEDPTAEQTEQADAYMSAHKRESDLWQVDESAQ